MPPPCVRLLPGACAPAYPLCPASSSDAAWTPLDLPSLVAEHLPGRWERVFWKLVLVLPDGEEQAPGSPGRSGRGFLPELWGWESVEKVRLRSEKVQEVGLLQEGGRTVSGLSPGGVEERISQQRVSKAIEVIER